MRMRHYREAAQAYKHAADLRPADLISVYNVGFALSRVGDPRSKEYFESAVRMFEQLDKSLRTPLWLANGYEAISHAYLGIGKPEKAVEALDQALDFAKSLGRVRVFSSLLYQYVPTHKFIAEARELRERAIKAVQATGRNT